MSVRARTGKTGIHVFISAIRPGERAMSGARTTISLTEKDAQTKAKAKFDALVTDAIAKGWVRKSASVGAVTSRFTEVPSPTSLPVGTPKVAPAAAAPAAAAPAADAPAADAPAKPVAGKGKGKK
jgi:hypothetical protein